MPSSEHAAAEPDRFVAPAAARVRFGIVLVLLGAALSLGGASAAGWIANMIVQWLAIAAIGWLVLTERGGVLPYARAPRWWLAIAAAMILSYLVPLPPALWTGLPGRRVVADGFNAAGLPLPWEPISMAPDATIRNALSLLVPLALFLLVARLPRQYRNHSVLLVVGAACIALLLGFVQLSDGPDSSFRFYAVTTPRRAVGQFANPNHLATLLVIAIPLLAVIGRAVRSPRIQTPWLHRRGLIGVAMTGVLSLGVVAAGSVAGYLLGLVAVLGLGLVATVRIVRRGQLLGFTLLLVSLAFLLVTANLLTGAIEFDTLSRTEAARQSSLIAWRLLPVGGGPGTFPELYRMASDPLLTTKIYLNHVHNDYIEVVLEMGVAGIALILLGTGWIAVRTVQVWTRERELGADTLARAASFVILLILMHSLVDYPLRTAALAAVFGWACGCLIDPPELLRRRTAVLAAEVPRSIDIDLTAFAGVKTLS